MTKIIVRLGKRSYPVLIGRRLLPCLGGLLKPLRLGRKVLIVTNREIARLFLKPLERGLARAGFEVVGTFRLSWGDERDKSQKSLARLWQTMAETGLERSSTVVALGGGVVGDVAGFAASTYMRGISLVQIPTTLLAQVDAAIGGKAAIDLAAAKNVIGTFYQPRLVVVDVETLSRLTARRLCELRNGFAEIIKYSMIRDRTLFGILERRTRGFFETVGRKRSLGDSEFSFLETVITRSVRVKAAVVAADERETKGKRMILNYGHTFAHAFEAASGYRMPHGEAVAVGMACAARLARLRGLLNGDAEERQRELIRSTGLPVRLRRRFSVGELLRPMQLDKKRVEGKLRLVLPVAIGRVRTLEDVSVSELKKFLQDFTS